jgi:hypothetical protein
MKLPLILLVVLVTGQVVALDEDEAKQPPTIRAAFAVAATMRSYYLDVQAIEPRWLYEKQIEKWFPIQSHASAVAVVTETPQPIPAALVESFSGLSVTDKAAEDYVVHGPMMGPTRSYILFDAQREPIVILYLHFGVLRAARAHQVSREDTFQAYEGWESYRRSPELVEFLATLDPAAQVESPFVKWKKEIKKPKAK